MAVGAVDGARAAHLGVVADAAQQAVGDARGAARAQGDLGGAVLVDGHVHHFGGALDDEAQLVFGVELEAQQDAEAGAQGRAEQAGPRGGADEGEGPNLHDVGARGGALADDDVELVVLERGVELFFEDGLQAVDLVEEEHLALAQVGEDGGEVALDLQRGAGGLLEADVELVGDDGGQGGFAQAGRAEEEHVIEGFAAGFGGFERDGQLLLGFGLADELAQPAGAQLELEALLFVGARGADQPFRRVVAGDGHAEEKFTAKPRVHFAPGQGGACAPVVPGDESAVGRT